jgi:hypothetical protein
MKIGRFFCGFRLISMQQALAGISLVGAAGLCFVFGAFVMYSEFPMTKFLKDFLKAAFDGTEAIVTRGMQGGPQTTNAKTGATIDKPDKTCDGFTLCATSQGARAVLLDMHGAAVHQWAMPYSRVWTEKQPAPAKDPRPDNEVYWCGCRLFPNGDLLAVYTAVNDTPYGYGLVKLDKDSNVKWAYAGNVHHDFDVDEDGNIYVLTHKIYTEMPKGLEFIVTPCLADTLVILSAKGEELQEIPLLEAFRDSGYALTLASLTGEAPRKPPPRQGNPAAPDPSAAADPAPNPNPALKNLADSDPLHANSVKVLSKALAPKFPLFKAGQVLISARNHDTIFVVDVPSRAVVWAAKGIWRHQHAADFLDNGHLLLYDNVGAVSVSRVLEYDPVTQAFPWSYSCEYFNAVRGMAERLPNGNTLIVDVESLRILEVTPHKEVAWECYCSLAWPSSVENSSASPISITTARRYSPDKVQFLKAGTHARP